MGFDWLVFVFLFWRWGRALIQGFVLDWTLSESGDSMIGVSE